MVQPMLPLLLSQA